jgi:two-component system, NarL family, response regulator NreC
MKQPLRLIVADDYPLFRSGISLLLNKNEYKIIYEASDGEELIKAVKEQTPDIVITDIQMPKTGGIEATRAIKQFNSSIKVIALTMFGEDDLVMDMLDAGADGYLLKSTDEEELKTAIEAVYAGGQYFCESTSNRLSKLIARRKKTKQDPPAELIPKEIEIIQLICEQYASKQISKITQLAPGSVVKYRNNIMKKTGATNMVGIVIYAIRNGLYNFEEGG